MIWPFKKKSTYNDQVHAVYNAIVAQSRQPVFYTDFLIPDDVTGRFDVLSLHISLVFIRLRETKGKEKEFSQSLFDLFFKDMDQSIREMGVSDVGVPKKIQKMGSLFYGLLEKLTNALDEKDENSLAKVINRNIYGDKDQNKAEKLSKYVLSLEKKLNAQDISEILAGKLEFLKP